MMTEIIGKKKISIAISGGEDQIANESLSLTKPMDQGINTRVVPQPTLSLK